MPSPRMTLIAWSSRVNPASPAASCGPYPSRHPGRRTVAARLRRSGLVEQHDRGGVAVDEVPAPHGSQLAGTEHAGDGALSHLLVHQRSVVVGLTEEVAAPAVARED